MTQREVPYEVVDLVTHALPSVPGLPQSKHFLSCFPCSPFKIANWNKHGKFIVFDEHVRVFVLFSYRPNQLPYIPLLLVIARAVQLSYNLYNGTRFINRRRWETHTTPNPNRYFFSNFSQQKHFLLSNSEF